MLSIINEQVVLKANGQEKEINGFIVKKNPKHMPEKSRIRRN